MSSWPSTSLTSVITRIVFVAGFAVIGAIGAESAGAIRNSDVTGGQATVSRIMSIFCLVLPSSVVQEIVPLPSSAPSLFLTVTSPSQVGRGQPIFR
jgi:hypothetical protein